MFVSVIWECPLASPHSRLEIPFAVCVLTCKQVLTLTHTHTHVHKQTYTGAFTLLGREVVASTCSKTRQTFRGTNTTFFVNSGQGVSPGRARVRVFPPRGRAGAPRHLAMSSSSRGKVRSEKDGERAASRAERLSIHLHLPHDTEWTLTFSHPPWSRAVRVAKLCFCAGGGRDLGCLVCAVCLPRCLLYYAQFTYVLLTLPCNQVRDYYALPSNKYKTIA